MSKLNCTKITLTFEYCRSSQHKQRKTNKICKYGFVVNFMIIRIIGAGSEIDVDSRETSYGQHFAGGLYLNNALDSKNATQRKKSQSLNESYWKDVPKCGGLRTHKTVEVSDPF